jgi:hypothetical protein
VVVQVDPADAHQQRHDQRRRYYQYFRNVFDYRVIIHVVQPNKHEIYDVGGKKPYKLCMRRRHSVFAVKIRPSQRSFFADRVLQAIV